MQRAPNPQILVAEKTSQELVASSTSPEEWLDEEQIEEVVSSSPGDDTKMHALAHRLLWLTFILFFASTALGKLWDRVYHLTHIFDTFWSPPHLFISAATASCAVLVIALAFMPRFRTCFGPRISIPWFPVEVAGALVIQGAGLFILSITILLDSAWHTAFGLDETQWSMPHDMLVISWSVILLGFISAQLAMHKHRPMHWLIKVALATIITGFLFPSFLGPFYLNYSPNLLHALATVPVIRAQEAAEHTYRIYLTAQLTRTTSPIFIPLVSLAAGTILTLLQKLDMRPRIFLLAPCIWSCIYLVRDISTLWLLHYQHISDVQSLLTVMIQEPSLWVPIPLFAAALLFYVLFQKGIQERTAWIWTGIVFSALTFCIWNTSPLMLLLIIPATGTMIAGNKIGRWMFHVMEQPDYPSILKFILIPCTQVPSFLGMIDLILRKLIP